MIIATGHAICGLGDYVQGDTQSSRLSILRQLLIDSFIKASGPLKPPRLTAGVSHVMKRPPVTQNLLRKESLITTRLLITSVLGWVSMSGPSSVVPKMEMHPKKEKDRREQTDTSHCLAMKAIAGWLRFSAHEGWTCKGVKIKQVLRMRFHKPKPQKWLLLTPRPARSLSSPPSVSTSLQRRALFGISV